MRTNGDLPYAGEPELIPPKDWISRDGLPAAVLGKIRPDSRTAGLPSSETEDGFQVYEMLYVLGGKIGQEVRMFPAFYGTMALLAPGGLVPQHHEPTQQWIYRPCIYRWDTELLDDERGESFGGWEMQGSQRELTWRDALHHTRKLDGLVEEVGKDRALAQFIMQQVERRRAEERAETLLESMLAPTQLLEYRLQESFRCFGGLTGNSYVVQAGNGFWQTDLLTNAVLFSYCLHPEDWMPDGDVALATKLQLEDPDLEEDFVAAANVTDRKPRIRLKPSVRRKLAYAADQERELVAA
jgi:hypothetical protein